MNTNPNYLQDPQNNPASENDPLPINKADDMTANLQAALPNNGISSVDNIISDMSQPLDFFSSELENRRWPEL